MYRLEAVNVEFEGADIDDPKDSHQLQEAQLSH
jgi:hypothetical protein